MLDILKDEYGYYRLEVEEVFDNRTIQWRKYDNSLRVKRAGGMYCSYCPETNQYRFYRNDYMRGRGFNKFIKDVQATPSEWDEVVNNEDS